MLGVIKVNLDTLIYSEKYFVISSAIVTTYNGVLLTIQGPTHGEGARGVVCATDELNGNDPHAGVMPR